MRETFPLQAISEIADAEKVRVVIFINGEFVHAPLTALLADLLSQIADLEARVAALEAP